MSKKQDKKEPSIRLNLVLTGEPATFLMEIKRRGLAKSNADAVRLALRELEYVIIERDLKRRKLDESRRLR